MNRWWARCLGPSKMTSRSVRKMVSETHRPANIHESDFATQPANSRHYLVNLQIKTNRAFFTNAMNKQTLPISTILTLAFLLWPDLHIPAAFCRTKPHQDFHYGTPVRRMNDETRGLDVKPAPTNIASSLPYGWASQIRKTMKRCR